MPFRDVAIGTATGASVTAAAILTLLGRYVRKELATPELHHAPPEERDEAERALLQEVKLLLRDYWPHPILEFSGYLSSAYSGFWAMMPTKIYPGRKEELLLDDGGTVGLHWCEKPTEERAAGQERIVLLLPGLNNDSRTGFIQGAMQHWREAGFHAVTLNYRGQGGLHLTSKRFGCFDSWRDIAPVLKHLEETHPGAELFGMGWSMGGMLLLRYLGEEGPRARFKAVVAVAAPVDLPATAEVLHGALKKRVMNFFMAAGCRLQVLAHPQRATFLPQATIGNLLRANTLRELDELIVVPEHGYKDADDYYASNCPRPLLQQIAVPTLMVNALDDPICASSNLPVEEIKRNPRLFMVLTRRGGHIGWGSGGLGAAAWTDNMAVDFVRACIPPGGAAPPGVPRSRL